MRKIVSTKFEIVPTNLCLISFTLIYMLIVTVFIGLPYFSLNNVKAEGLGDTPWPCFKGNI